MNESVNRTKVYARLLAAALDKLASGYRDRLEAQELLETSKALLGSILDTMPTGSEGPYANIKAPTLAIMDHLRTIGKPASIDEVADAVYGGGFRRGVDSIGNIKRAIGRFSDEGSRQLRVKNGLVGLGEWPEEWYDLE